MKYTSYQYAQTKRHLALMRVNCDDEWASVSTSLRPTSNRVQQEVHRARVMVALHFGATTPTTRTNGSAAALYRFLRLSDVLESTPVYYNASIRRWHSMQMRCYATSSVELDEPDSASARVLASCETDDINSCGISGPMA